MPKKIRKRKKPQPRVAVPSQRKNPVSLPCPRS